MRQVLRRGRRASTLAARGALLLGLAMSLGPAVHAADEAKAPPVRKEIGVIFNAAKALLTDKKYQESLDKLREADAIPDHTAVEQGYLDQIAIIDALQLDNMPVAIKALEGLPDSVTADRRVQFLSIIAKHYYNAKDFPTAVIWFKKCLELGDFPAYNSEMLLARSYYFAKDYANALSLMVPILDKQQAAGTVPEERDLQIVQSAAMNTKDTAHYNQALKQLVINYPTPERWDDLIHTVIDQPGFPREKRALDVFRLMAATGAMTQAAQFHNYAMEALQYGYPAEAMRALSKGPDAGKPSELTAQARKDYDSDQKSLLEAEREGHKAASGDILVKLGIDYYGYGQNDKAIALIQAGIAKGKLKSPDDATLDLAIAYLAAGDKEKAIEGFKKVTATGGPAELAQLWLLRANAT